MLFQLNSRDILLKETELVRNFPINFCWKIIYLLKFLMSKIELLARETKTIFQLQPIAKWFGHTPGIQETIVYRAGLELGSSPFPQSTSLMFWCQVFLSPQADLRQTKTRQNRTKIYILNKEVVPNSQLSETPFGFNYTNCWAIAYNFQVYALHFSTDCVPLP